jgi:hypothetical protein
VRYDIYMSLGGKGLILSSTCLLLVVVYSSCSVTYIRLSKHLVVVCGNLEQCFSTAGLRPGTGPCINYTGLREFVILVSKHFS